MISGFGLLTRKKIDIGEYIAAYKGQLLREEDLDVKAKHYGFLYFFTHGGISLW